MRIKRLLRAMTLTTPPMSYDRVKKSLHVIRYKLRIKYKRYHISTKEKKNCWFVHSPEHDGIGQERNNCPMKSNKNLSIKQKAGQKRMKHDNKIYLVSRKGK